LSLLSPPPLTTPADELRTKAIGQNNHGKKRKIRWESPDEMCVPYNKDFPAHPFVWLGFEPRERESTPQQLSYCGK
jgi:hypothetical protein